MRIPLEDASNKPSTLATSGSYPRFDSSPRLLRELSVSLLPFTALLGLITGFVGRGKGESFFVWWLFGTVAFPVALLFVLLQKDQRRRCPFCVEPVHRQASVCPHCQRDLVVATA